MFKIAELSGTYVCVYPHWERYKGAEVVVKNGLCTGHMFGTTFVCHWLIVVFFESFCDAFGFDQFAHGNVLRRTLTWFLIGDINTLNDIFEDFLILMTCLGIILTQPVREDALVELLFEC